MILYQLAAAVVAFGLGSLLNPAHAQQPGNHPLDGAFNKHDLNKDGFLDAAELAKAFRGPSAKVIPNEAGKEIHPDHAFLDAWDANKDGKISKAEFEKYEQKTLASLRVANNRNRNYTRFGRPSYRNPYRHRGYAGRGYGSNPYLNQVRYVQRYVQMQRRAYYNLMRYGVYSPNARGGYRGAMHHGRRR